MSITLSSRFIQVLTRYLEMNRSSIEKTLNENEDGEPSWHYNKDICVDFYFDRLVHEGKCDKYDEEDNDNNYVVGECDTCGLESITYIMKVLFFTENRWKIIEQIEWKKGDTLSMIEENLSQLSGKTYSFCKCGDLAVKKDQCSPCYVNSYIRTEEEGGDCPICYENDGRWVEIDCKHIFHMACLKKVKTESSFAGYRKCPLCRSVSETLRYDPFNK